MRRANGLLHALLVCVACLACASGPGGPQTTAALARGAWRPLFNGRDLEGWVPKINHHPLGENYRGTFTVKDGAIRVSYDHYDAFGDQYGHLIYRTPVAAFRLRFQYRFYGDPMPGIQAWQRSNSGVLFHGQAPETMAVDQPFPVSIEVQLLGADGDQPRPTGNVCTPGTHVVIAGKLATEHCIESSGPTLPNGPWVAVELEVRPDGQVVHVINGQVVRRYREPQLDPTDPYAQPLIERAGGERLLRQGYLSLQSEGHPIEFKDIELMEL